MANLFTRIKDTVVADFHGLLDEKEKKNPLALLNQYLRECEAEVEKVSKLVERQSLLKEEFNREYQGALEMAEKRKAQSDIALQAGESDLHEFASMEARQYADRASYVKTVYDQAGLQLSELERKYEEMKHKLKDMQIKRMELMGRENMARASHKVSQVLNESNYSDQSFSRFNELEGYLDRLEQQVSASYYRSTIDSKIAKLEKELKNKETHSIS
ncbi:phage shock protein A [Peribacillus deserti]|uniref:Phage shock protein A n=1 Tax=Peribacillus deserti TaxID=673318 RepID=A0ABS2QBQ2_9BACI|nr:PspA/IM30 family protein [Peribacillus deserti]MBM7690601.1 phage shock protein A [Peribacillus deserti]